MKTKPKVASTAPCCTDTASVVAIPCTPPQHKFELVQDVIENDVETGDATSPPSLPRQTQPQYIAVKGLS